MPLPLLANTLRRLAALTGVLVLPLLLVACGGDDDTDSTTPAPETPAACTTAHCSPAP